MRAIVQRVSAATVQVDGREVGRCGFGLVLLVGIHKDDTENEALKLGVKISKLRIFNDADGKLNRSLLDFQLPEGGLDADVLAVSNFTVYGDCNQGNRPSYASSAGFEKGETLFIEFVEALRAQGVSVQTGLFGANMMVSLVNSGPVTVIVDVTPIKSE